MVPALNCPYVFWIMKSRGAYHGVAVPPYSPSWRRAAVTVRPVLYDAVFGDRACILAGAVVPAALCPISKHC